MSGDGEWTRDRVEKRLIDAFRRMPLCPVFGTGRRLQVATRKAGEDVGIVIEPLQWAGLLDRDPDGRKYLWAWARCQATRQSFGELCDLMGWARSTAETGRRRSATALALLLARQSSRSIFLDREKA